MSTTDVHTRNDTIGCAAVLLAILLGVLSGAYLVYSESAPVAVATNSPS